MTGSNSQRFDVVIVGGGAIGLSIADQLLQVTQASLDIALISPSNSKGEASQAAGAMIDTFGELDKLESPYDRQKLSLKLQAQRLYPQWLAGIAARSGQAILQKFGMFIVTNAAGQDDAARFALIQDQLRAWGETWETVTSEDIPGFQPQTEFTAHRALFMPEALTIDMEELLLALNGANQRSARYTRLDDRTLAVEQAGTLWQIQTQTHGTILTEKLVVCAGAHTMRVLGEGLQQQTKLPPVYFGLGSSFVVTDGPHIPYGIRTPNRSGASSVHVVPRRHDRLYLGANNLLGTDFDQPLGASVADLSSLFDAVVNQLNMGLRQANVGSLTWGLRPITPDDRVLAGETNLPGLFIVTGTHRTGVHLAPVLAQIVADELLHHSPKFENPFSPKR